jgi:hypothetical protein
LRFTDVLDQVVIECANHGEDEEEFSLISFVDLLGTSSAPVTPSD